MVECTNCKRDVGPKSDGPWDCPYCHAKWYQVTSPCPEQIRGATHGDYDQMSMAIQTIKEVIHNSPNWPRLEAGKREALELIATKIGRIVCGDPNHPDHWADIAGYANLAHARIPQSKD